MTEKYDVAIIGAGPGGYVAAIRAAQLGLKVVCIEKRKQLGGTCLNEGCIPSKTLLQATELYDFLLKKGKSQGIEAKELSVDFPQMMKRKTEVVKSLVDGVSGLFKKNKITRIEGVARFVSTHALEVKGDTTQTIEADNFIIATGSESVSLTSLPFDEKRILSSTGALSLSEVPKKLLIVGAGVIGVELASVYSRLGSEVIVVEMLEDICAGLDHSISKGLLQILKKQGIVFHLSSQVTSVKPNADNVSVSFKEGDHSYNLLVDAVLVAVGRKPYTKGLGLGEIGVEVASKGFVKVDDEFRTSVPHIFAIGDTIEGVMLAHRASEEGIAAVEIIAGQHPHINYMAIPNVIYTHPEVAVVGMTENEALSAGLKLKIGTFSFKANARARCAGDDDGLVKVIGEEKSDRLIGMHIIGPHASELIAEGVLAIEKKATLSEIAGASHAHPTLSEAIKEACLNALGRTIHI